MVADPHTEGRVRTCDAVSNDLSTLRDTYGYTWRQIACLSPYDAIGIPPGTLTSIYKTGVIPARWQVPLGLPAVAPAPVCPVCQVVHLSSRCPASPRRSRSLEPAIRIGKVTDTERAGIMRLTPQERKAALLEAAGRKAGNEFVEELELVILLETKCE